MSSEFVIFLNNINKELALIVGQMEQLIFTSPAASVTEGRKLLEVIINDILQKEELVISERSSLSDKIYALNQEGYFTKEIHSILTSIRKLGNEATHSPNFNDISEALRCHKLCYQAITNYIESYHNPELRVPEYNQPRVLNNLDDKIGIIDQKLAHLSDLIQKTNPTKSSVNPEDTINLIENNSASHHKLTQDMPKYSFLYDALRKLSNSSKEAIENINLFNEMKQYLHVERHIQTDLEDLLHKKASENSPSLILLAGSVGDGKSHLLSYLRKNRPDLMKHFTIHNDATESFSPSLSALDTLKLVLKHFSDQHIDQNSNTKLILAINLGVLHNFLYSNFVDLSFTKLRDILDAHHIFEEKSIEQVDTKFVSLINFSNYQSFELSADHVSSLFYSNLLKKVFSIEADNLFYKAYLEDKKYQLANSLLHENFIFMCNPIVQKHIVRMLIELTLQHKINLSARSFLNFLADIVIPQEIHLLENRNHHISVSELIKHGTPNLLFNRSERSNILDLFVSKDPLTYRSLEIDSYLVKFNTSNSWREICEQLNIKQLNLPWIELILTHYERNFNEKDEDFLELYSFIIRYLFLSDSSFFNNFQDPTFDEFIKVLYGYNINDQKTLKSMYSHFEDSIFSWRNSSKPYFYLDAHRNPIRLAQKLRLTKVPSGVDNRKKNTSDSLTRFITQIKFVYRDKKNQLFHLDCDYNLFSYLNKVRSGYVSTPTDQENFVSFVEFIDKLIQNGHKDSELIIYFTQLNESYELVKESFGDDETYSFRRKGQYE
ncbi:DNA phosphorothioation-dependent restriction protein DptF [Paenibacillus sp. FSL W7-1287]|uniref:DNA phosphorothioation-dependent restriction protein DptF n=1 Tax=Paenibacillus sp. FSL W7-1287 TaxID=2954538 RepID=UPI0030F9436D